MKIQKYIIVLVLLPLFFGVGYADDNVTAKSSSSSTDSKLSFEIDLTIFDEAEKAKTDRLKAEAAKAANEAEGNMEEIIAENEAASLAIAGR
jgi:hypothetical protein